MLLGWSWGEVDEGIDAEERRIEFSRDIPILL
jgi:hypothetical protein